MLEDEGAEFDAVVKNPVNAWSNQLSLSFHVSLGKTGCKISKHLSSSFEFHEGNPDLKVLACACVYVCVCLCVCVCVCVCVVRIFVWSFTSDSHLNFPS